MSKVSEISDVRDSCPSLPAASLMSSVIRSKNALASSSLLTFSISCSFLTSASLGSPSHSVLSFLGDGALLTAGVLTIGSSSSRCLFKLPYGDGALGCTGSDVGGILDDLRFDWAVGLGLEAALPLGDFGVFG